MVRQHFTETQEAILQRKISGSASGQYDLSDEDKLQIVRFQEVLMDAQREGVEARQDMQLLNEVLSIEPFFIRLQQPVVKPEYDEQNVQINIEVTEKDHAERAAAEEIVKGSSTQALEILKLRNPEPEKEIEPELVTETENVEQHFFQPDTVFGEQHDI